MLVCRLVIFLFAVHLLESGETRRKRQNDGVGYQAPPTGVEYPRWPGRYRQQPWRSPPVPHISPAFSGPTTSFPRVGQQAGNAEVNAEGRRVTEATTATKSSTSTRPSKASSGNIGESEGRKGKCFINEFGFKCCSTELMRFMLYELNHPTKSVYYRGCNLQKSASVLQREATARFNVSFEIFSATSDYINKGRFLGKWMCKIRSQQGKIVMMYGHPNQYTLDAGASRPLTIREFEQRQRENGWTADDLVETDVGMEDI